MGPVKKDRFHSRHRKGKNVAGSISVDLHGKILKLNPPRHRDGHREKRGGRVGDRRVIYKIRKKKFFF